MGNDEIWMAGEPEYAEEAATGAEKAAIALLATYIFFTVVVSTWSGVILLDGSPGNGGPLGYLVNFILRSNIF